MILSNEQVEALAQLLYDTHYKRYNDAIKIISAQMKEKMSDYANELAAQLTAFPDYCFYHCQYPDAEEITSRYITENIKSHKDFIPYLGTEHFRNAILVASIDTSDMETLMSKLP